MWVFSVCLKRVNIDRTINQFNRMYIYKFPINFFINHLKGLTMKPQIPAPKKSSKLFIAICVIVLLNIIPQNDLLFAQSLDIPSSKYGISFGNSKYFTGLRFNLVDKHVDRITGINVTFWKSKENEEAIMRGISLGIIPEAGDMGYIQLGVAGVGATHSLSGLTMGILGAGAGGDISGITIGGLGAGAGGSVTGISIGGLGVGGGKNLTGINIGGLGAGAGGDVRGLSLGLFGVGAGQNMWGINIGGLGAGAGQDIFGITLGGLGAGAGQTMTGINIGGLGVGAGQELRGLSLAVLAAGSPSIKGITIGGLAVGGVEITGITLSIAHVRIEDDGILTGFGFSAFNYVKGLVRGVTLGIVNYAYEVNGIQLGLVNYVEGNPSGLKILPLFNTNF